MKRLPPSRFVANTLENFNGYSYALKPWADANSFSALSENSSRPAISPHWILVFTHSAKLLMLVHIRCVAWDRNKISSLLCETMDKNGIIKLSIIEYRRVVAIGFMIPKLIQITFFFSNYLILKQKASMKLGRFKKFKFTNLCLLTWQEYKARTSRHVPRIIFVCVIVWKWCWLAVCHVRFVQH